MNETYNVVKGRVIKILREEESLTQGELAARVNVSPSYISKYERGNINLENKLSLKVDNYFKIKESDVIKYQKGENLTLLINYIYFMEFKKIKNTIIIESNICLISNLICNLAKEILDKNNNLIFETLKQLYTKVSSMNLIQTIMFEYLVITYKINIFKNLEAYEQLLITKKRVINNPRVKALLIQIESIINYKLNIEYKWNEKIEYSDRIFLKDNNLARVKINFLIYLNKLIELSFYDKVINEISRSVLLEDNEIINLYSKMAITRNKNVLSTQLLNKLCNYKSFFNKSTLYLSYLFNDNSYLKIIDCYTLNIKQKLFYDYIKIKNLNDYDMTKKHIYINIYFKSFELEDYSISKFYLNEYLNLMSNKLDIKRYKHMLNGLDDFKCKIDILKNKNAD